MAHRHSVYDTESHFRIDKDSREVINVSETDTVLFRGDHNSERFTFEIPRMIDGHDMSLCDIVEIHYNNVGSISREAYRDVYEVMDLQVSPDDSDVVICSWLISCNATRYVGDLKFSISFKCTDENGKICYSWSTAIHENVSIAETYDNGEEVAERYSDIFEEWESILFNEGLSSSGSMNIVDSITGKTYKLYVSDGKLMMSEVTA